MSDVFKEKLNKALLDSWKKTIPSSEFWDDYPSLHKRIRQVRNRSEIDVLRKADRRNKRSVYRPGIELSILNWLVSMYDLGCRYNFVSSSGYVLSTPCCPSVDQMIRNYSSNDPDHSNLDFKKFTTMWVPNELAVRIVSLGYIP